MSPPAVELPAELLGEMFALCLPDKASKRLDPRNAPMVLCQVCPYWHQAALSEPRLWDTVIFPAWQASEQRIGFRKYQKFIVTGGVQRWFDRSGPNHLLTFGDEGALHQHASHLPLFLPIVTKYARRLKYISVALNKPRYLETVRKGFPCGIFDNLASVAISCPLDMSPTQLQGFEEFDTPFNTSPKLKHVSLMLLRNANPFKLILPWSQLSSVEIDSHFPLSFRRWREVFAKCTSLQYGTFTIPAMVDLHNVETLEHQALNRLRFLVQVGRVAWVDWEFLYQPVHFPNLRHLEFDYKNADNLSSPSMLLKPDTRKSLSSLQSLTFHAPAAKPHQVPPDVERIVEQLAAHPKALPSLTHIILPYRNFRLYDIALMLLPRSPTADHPGLTASVYVVLNGRKESYNRVLENIPEVASRYSLAGLTRAPCELGHEEDWEDSENEFESGG